MEAIMTTSSDVVTRLVAHATAAGAEEDLDADVAVQQLREIAGGGGTLLDEAMAAVWAGGGALEERRRPVELLARARYEEP
jgi:hypothetical protein